MLRYIVAAIVFTVALARQASAQCPDGTPPPCRAAARPTRSSAPAMSVAVLDFENRSSDTGDTYLSEGLADELTSRLGQVGRLTVASRSAVERLHNVSAMAIAEIGRSLNVSYLVHGSLRRSGARLRVTVELVRAATGAQEWSSQYDESRQDLLQIQEAVATAVVTAVAGRLLPAERTSLAARPTRSAEAYDAFVRGQVLNRKVTTSADYFAAINQFQRAVTIDSGFAEAWAQLSVAHSSAFWSYVDRSDERLALARSAADRAVRLAPDAVETHVALGYYSYWGSRDYARALQEFSAALAANPGKWDVFGALANVARRQGAWEQSLASRTRGIELDPGNAVELASLSETLGLLRRYDEAERTSERALAALPGFVTAYAHLAEHALRRDGTLDRARVAVESLATHAEDAVFFQSAGDILAVWRMAGPHQDAILRSRPGASPEARAAQYLVVGTVLVARGRGGESAPAFDSLRVIVEEMLRRRPDDDGLHAHLARAYAGLGRCPEALREAERAVALLPVSADALDGQERLQNLAEIESQCARPDQAIEHLTYLLSIPSWVSRPLLRVDPVYAPLRADPRFQRLVGAIGH